ncbi:MAG: T9SS type A sorting domain-containing protein [Chitinispirillaceae bacterium]|nr:T9SS type A sorting domain-containing protein [Chitinispirillaceae bacterium]
MKRHLFICIVPALTFAADYFPFERGNAWNFSYESRISIVVPNPPTTRDSGSVRWEISSVLGNSISLRILIRQTRSLARSTVFGGPEPGYDSTFTPPRVTVDTVLFTQDVAASDTGRTRDSLQNAVSFSGIGCPVAFHDPEKPLAAALVIHDTVIRFAGSDRSCIATIPPECSCRDNNAWSFVLTDTIGPVGVAITRCPGFVGTGYFETWRLTSREYPAPVRSGGSTAPCNDRILIVAHHDLVRLTLPGPASVAMCSVSGRTIKRFATTSSGTVTWNVASLPQGVYLLRVATEAGSIGKEIFLGR